MGISNFLGLFGLLSLPVIIILYMFRPRHKLQQVPSVFLWMQINEDLSKAKKIEKLKKSLLFFLDILIALLITALLLGIFISSSKVQKHQIILINGSFSMNSDDIKPNRFEKAKEQAAEYINNLSDDTKVSVVLVKETPQIVCNKETKNQAKNSLENLKISLENIDFTRLNDCIIKLKDGKEASVIYFTDDSFKYAENVIIKENSDNLAITSMSSKLGANNINTAITIENESDSDQLAQVSIYDKDLFLNTKNVRIKAKSSEVIFFENINQNIPVLKAVIDNEDINKLDNTYYDITKTSSKKKIALVSNGHYFLEKYLSLNDNYEIYKVKPEEYKGLQGFDCYIYDGFLPETLATDGNILVLDPNQDSKNQEIKASGFSENPSFTIAKHQVNQFIDKQNFNIALSQVFDIKNNMDAIYTVDDKCLAYTYRNGLQKHLVFGFDFRYTDLPLKADFPILMNNVFNYLLDEKMTDKYKYAIGDKVTIYLKPLTNSASITKSDNTIIDLNVDADEVTFSDTFELGLYKIEQLSSSENSNLLFSSYFAINPPNKSMDKTIEFDNRDAEVLEFKSKEDIDKILIIMLVLCLLLELFIRIYKKPLSQKALLALRCIIILFIILSFMHFKLSFTAKYTDTIFVADYSESMFNKDSDVNHFIEQSLENATTKDNYGIISFAKYPTVEKMLSDNSAFNNINPSVSKEASNIEKAVEKAEIMFDPEHKKRIVLITDGRENEGDLLKKVSQLKDANIALDVLPIVNNNFKEVEIDNITVPKHAKKGQDIQVDVSISSSVNTNCKIYLYNRNDLIDKKDVSIKSGKQNFVFYSKANQTGILEYRVEIVPIEDTYSENNKLSSFINVDGKLKILVVQNESYGENYANIFDDFDVTLIDQSLAPISLDELLYYDAFILADCSLEVLNEKFVENVASLVKNNAKSLIVSGGHNSFQMGGYNHSKLEEILPVEMNVKDKEKRENMAMVLVIDRSGSMADGEYGVQKINLAKEAAVRASEVLEEEDYLGVIGFNGSPEWFAELAKITDKATYEQKILSMNAGGGTSIQPALREAINALKDNPASLKHIILLTDGMAENTGYEPFINQLNEYKISLSSIAVGNEADKRLLNFLAKNGKGRYYESNVFTDIPTIFAKETILAGKKFINNISFYPKLNSAGKIFDGIDAIPQLHGYIACAEKPLAKVFLLSEDDDPILASINYGLGKTLVFTSDMHGLWSKDFLAWQNNKKFWHNILSHLLNQDLSSKFELSSEYKDNQVILHLAISEDTNIKDKEIKCQIVSNNGQSEEISLALQSPYLYEARFKPQRDGLHLLSSSIKINDENTSFTSAFIVPYPREYNFFEHKAVEAKEIVDISGGRILKDASEVFKGELPSVESSYDLNKILLIIALILFLIELIFRITNYKIKAPKVLKKVKIGKSDLDNKDDNAKDIQDTKTTQKIKGRKKQKKQNEEQSSAKHVDELLKKF